MTPKGLGIESFFIVMYETWLSHPVSNKKSSGIGQELGVWLALT